MPSFTLGSTRPPTAKERAALETRRERLKGINAAGRIDAITATLQDLGRASGGLATDGLRIRRGFSYKTTPASPDTSDRKAPPPVERPPATRIITSRGAALRFELTLLALTQLVRKPGAKARLTDLNLPLAGDSQTTAWADLVAAAPSGDSQTRDGFYSSRDKRTRSVRTALTTLEAAGLVSTPRSKSSRQYDKFVLLQEAGREAQGESEEYTVPKAGAEDIYTLAPGFVTNGWLHSLEDSEICLLLMIACRHGGFIENGLLAMPGEVRLRHYGIHRDRYSAARKTLEWFGLIRVEESGRRGDGRALDDERLLHRMAISTDGFAAPALETIRTNIEHQLRRPL